MHPQQLEGTAVTTGGWEETRELSLVVLNLRGLTFGSGAQMGGLEALGDCGHGPSRGLNRNDSRSRKKKVSARTIMGPVWFSWTSRLQPPCQHTTECGEDAPYRSMPLLPPKAPRIHGCWKNK